MKFHIMRSGKQFYFVIKDGNNKVVATSETYKRKATMLKTIRAIADFDIVDHAG